LSGSTEEAGAGDILFGSTAAAAGCASFGSTVGGLAGSTVVSGAGDVLFGSTAEPGGCASFSSTAGALSGSTEEEGAGDIVFGSTAAAAGCASFGSTAAAGSSAGVFVSCGGRGRGSGGDDTIRWRCAPDPMTWWIQVITLCAILESDDRALGGVGGCCPCAWADAAANNCRDKKNVAAPNTLDRRFKGRRITQLRFRILAPGSRRHRLPFPRISSRARPTGVIPCARAREVKAVEGEDRYLLDVELLARRLQNFSISNPSIMETARLPDWKHSDHMAWPPPKIPLGALVATAMTPPHDPRFSADWAAAREQDMARRAAAQARRAEEEEARQAESRRVYEASLRR
jgi:hypothetical protein